MAEQDEFIGYEIPVELTGLSLEEIARESQHQFNFETDNEAPRSHFDIMEIHITLYNFSGILYQTKKTTEKRLRRFEKAISRRKHNKSAKTTPSRSSDNYTTEVTTTQGNATISTISESTSQLTLAGFEADTSVPPITAVVSSTRYDPNSEHPMETFMPSLPLRRLSRGDANSLRYSARWDSDSNSRYIEPGEVSSPTMKILRLMHQQPYARTTNIAEISAYEHEKIDLCVFLGRGKEMLPLGIVSFIVTGDEETELILNLPLKKPAMGSILFERHLKQSKRKKSAVADSFDSDPKHTFSIDTNAALRIGVRAFPQRSFLEANERSAVAREKEEQVFESILQEMLDSDLLANLRDESSLIQKLVEGQKEKIQQEDQQKVVEVLQEEAPTPVAALQPPFFCNFPFFPNGTCPGQNENDVPQQVVTVKRNDPNVPLSMPLTLVSSVSDSISTEGGHSNTRFLNQPINY